MIEPDSPDLMSIYHTFILRGSNHTLRNKIKGLSGTCGTQVSDYWRLGKVAEKYCG